MNFVYVLTPELRMKLKKPLGILIKGSFSETMAKVRDLIAHEKPPEIISVGDTVSRNLVENGIIPKLAVVDNKVMRKKTKPVKIPAKITVNAVNPAGTITKEAVVAIKEALERSSTVRIVVDGEEDLLTLITVIYAAENSFVIYGQPREGVVLIKVTKEKKGEIAEILKAMKSFEKLNNATAHELNSKREYHEDCYNS